MIGSMPATNAAGTAAVRSDITVATSSMTTIANACAFGVARLEKRDDKVGPSRTAQSSREHEFAPPRARSLFLVAAIEKRDRQRIADRDRAGDKAYPGDQRAGVDPRQRHRADAEGDNPEHRRGAAVDLSEQTHHGGRMARDHVGLGEGLARLPQLNGQLAPACGRLRPAPGPDPMRPRFTHHARHARPYSRQSWRRND